MQEIMSFAGRHPILCLAWIVLLVLVVTITVKGWFSNVKSISRGEATLLINKQNAVVVDVRTRDDYRKGHISGALNIPAADIANGNVAGLEQHKSNPVIVVCANGTSAADSAAKLSTAGFTQVYILKEGISGWSGDNLPLIRGK